VPTSVCRAYEQPLVVAVNLNYDIYGRSAVVKHSASVQPMDDSQKKFADSNARIGVASTMVQAFNIIQERISRARLAGDPPDLALHPRVGDIGMSEFHRAGEAIDRGYAETMAQIGALKRMQDVFAR
jgi:NTE family protein